MITLGSLASYVLSVARFREPFLAIDWGWGNFRGDWSLFLAGLWVVDGLEL
jgi:hypothetical protein